LSVEIWIAAATLVVAIVCGYWALGKMLVNQFTKALDVRFESLEVARKEGRKASDERFKRLEDKQERLDQDVRKILIELPREYVRREDYVRGQTVIEAKLDALATRLENAQLRGTVRD
jgi:hypothetical protein